MKDSIFEQIRRNLVAIISLTVALSGLGYNTWRNERSEQNSNIRTAGFEVLTEVGELQRVVFFSHYDQSTEYGSPRAGWAHILTIHDLSQVIPDPVPGEADRLRAVWETQWEGLGESETSVAAINAAIDAYRLAVLDMLRSLR
ncbi:MAG: hypothetical protein K8I04_05505 [Gammaproteobacteria bacterium]|nr:hypothetical protein [Gammaproteobacteria bacterium]